MRGCDPGASRAPFAGRRAGGTGILAWGENNFDQLGYPAVPDHTLPRNVVLAATGPCDAAGMRSISQISAGAWGGMALLNDSAVCSWGLNNFGQLGQGPKPCMVLTPGPVCAPYSTTFPCIPLLDATAIGTGGLFGLVTIRTYHPNSSVALTNAVVSFGSAMTGELGRGRTFMNTDVPELVCGIVGTPTNGPVCPAGLGRCALAEGHADEGRDLLRQAQEIFQRIGAAEAADLAAELA